MMMMMMTESVILILRFSYLVPEMQMYLFTCPPIWLQYQCGCVVVLNGGFYCCFVSKDYATFF